LWFAQAADSHELLVFRFQLLRKKPRGMIEFSKLLKIELCVFGFGIPIAEREREREREPPPLNLMALCNPTMVGESALERAWWSCSRALL